MQKPTMLIIFTAFLVACNTNRVKNTAVLKEKQLTGEWRNHLLKVEFKTFNNTDKDSTLEVTADNWEQIMKMQAIRTHFRENGTYNSEHRNLKDSVFYNPAGYWSVAGDTLIMRDTFPQKIEYRMWYSVKDSIAEFKSILDFDGDGKADDIYYGTQKKKS